jgi:hypothetical protein
MPAYLKKKKKFLLEMAQARVFGYLQDDEARHALQRDKRSCRQLPRIVTGVQPVRGEIGRHGEE